MSLTKLTENLNNIASLPDKPSVEATALKQLFDKAGNDIKSYINQVLTEELDTLIASNYTTLNNRILANASTITQAQLDKIYPVGSIYMSVNTTDPSQLMGGTWERIKDKFLLASGDTYANGSTGGSATHSHTNPNTGTYSGNTGTYSGNTGSTALTINQIPAHNHQMFSYIVNTSSTGGGYNVPTLTNATKAGTKTETIGGSQGHTHTMNHAHTMNHSHTIGNTGSSSNMPPYLAVCVWKRIS